MSHESAHRASKVALIALCYCYTMGVARSLLTGYSLYILHYYSSERKKSKPVFTNLSHRVRKPFRSISYTFGGCDSSDLHRRSKGISFPVGDLCRHFTKLTGPSAYILHSNLIPPDGKNGLL